ncbi:MAG: UpxY family transcription antiterminator [Bacteroidales bacterium]|nr:UpxY family transcription antiterminator [Bacteroidales bacterium]
MNYTSKKWYVFYTYPKFERKVHKYLQQENYESFLPLHWVVRQWSDRKKRLQVPLFPNYIFVNIERNKICEVLKTPKLISCVTFNRIPAFLKQKEVDSIIQIVENEYPFEVCCNLKIGDLVEITQGALMGMEGVLVEEKGNHRFALKIESLQQSMLVNVPSNCLEFLEVMV